MNFFDKITLLRDLRCIPGIAKSLLIIIATHIGNNDFAWLSLKLLTDESCFSLASVKRSLIILSDLKILSRLSPDSSFPSTRYIIDYIEISKLIHRNDECVLTLRLTESQGGFTESQGGVHREPGGGSQGATKETLKKHKEKRKGASRGFYNPSSSKSRSKTEVEIPSSIARLVVDQEKNKTETAEERERRCKLAKQNMSHILSKLKLGDVKNGTH